MAFTMTNTADSGAGSLRQALLDSVAAGGTPTIEVHCGTGKVEVTPLSPLPVIPGPIRINALTQEGANDDRPMLHLNGAALAAAGVPMGVDPITGAGGLQFLGGDQVLQGVGFKNFPTSALLATATNGLVLICVSTGLDLDGITKAGNLAGATLIGAKNTTVGGKKARTDCVFSGSGNPSNLSPGFIVSNGDTITFSRSRAGTTWAGDAAVGNYGSGFKVFATPNALFGGFDDALRCVASGNTGYGFEIAHPGSNGTRLINVFASMSASGLVAIPNSRSNILLYNVGRCWIKKVLSSGGIRNGLNCDGSTPTNPPLPILTDDYSSKGFDVANLIEDCIFGLDINLQNIVPNLLANVLLTQAQRNRVYRSILCGAGQDGATILGRTDLASQAFPGTVPSFNEIVGCWIGQRPDGTAAGNTRHGVYGQSANGTLVGDPADYYGKNAIGFNGTGNSGLAGYAIVFRGYGFNTQRINTAANVISGNGHSDKILIKQ